MQLEREQSRQVWLAAFGLTPWVASARLPGARPSRLLHLPAEETAEPPVTLAPPPVPPVAQTRAPTPDPTPVKQDAATPATGPAPRLCIYQTEQTLIIVEQQDPQAPELGRDEQQLLLALLHLFGNEHKRYPFLCPKQPQQAQDTLCAFVGGLAMQGCSRVLLCLQENACRHLLGGQARYERFQLADLPAMVISSLGEMLAAPLVHKPRSWACLCEAGLDH